MAADQNIAPLDDDDTGDLMTQVYNWRGREETVCLPESEALFHKAVRIGARTIMVTRDQIREWGLSIDICEVPNGTSLELLFADDDDFYAPLVFNDFDSLGMERRMDPITR